MDDFKIVTTISDKAFHKAITKLFHQRHGSPSHPYTHIPIFNDFNCDCDEDEPHRHDDGYDSDGSGVLDYNPDDNAPEIPFATEMEQLKYATNDDYNDDNGSDSGYEGYYAERQRYFPPRTRI